MFVTLLSKWLVLPLAVVALGVEATAPHAEDRSLLITLAGDSITAGIINDPLLPGHLTAQERICWQGLCYARLVEAAMKELDPPISTVNVGVGGSTSRDWDPNDFETQDPHYQFNSNPFLGRLPLFRNIPASSIVFVVLGTNDATGIFEISGPTSAEDFAAHLHDIATTLLQRGVRRVVLVTPPIPAGWSGEGHAAGERMRGYADAVRQVCGALSGRYDDCLLDLQREYPPDEWMGSHFHPTMTGHRFIAERMIEHIERLVTRFDRRRRSGWRHRRER